MSRFSLVSAFFLLLAAGCADDDEPAADGAAGKANEPECFESPTTHQEIINACTTALKVKKTPRLKLLNPDGSLPPP